MNCVKCSGETRVVNSRPHKDDARVIQRRRWCDACGHKFNTFESTINAASVRANRAKEKARQRLNTPVELRQARIKRDNMRKAARIEAKSTGRPLPEILQAWGLAA